jgi:hypothetical protein
LILKAFINIFSLMQTSACGITTLEVEVAMQDPATQPPYISLQQHAREQAGLGCGFIEAIGDLAGITGSRSPKESERLKSCPVVTGQTLVRGGGVNEIIHCHFQSWSRRRENNLLL